MTIADAHRAELGRLLARAEAEALEASDDWELYGITILLRALGPNANPWAAWQAAVAVAAREDVPGVLAALAMTFLAALQGDVGAFDEGAEAAAEMIDSVAALRQRGPA